MPRRQTVDFSDLAVLDLLSASGGSELVITCSKEDAAERYLLHRVGSRAKQDEAIVAILRARNFIFDRQLYLHVTQVTPPLHEVDAAIPRLLSAVVRKLLSKDPSMRYQSVAGLRADLSFARSVIAGESSACDVPVARFDLARDLRISPRLYGREREKEELLATYERVCAGARECMIFSGPAGIGKTSLIRECYLPITQQCAFLIAGIFEQYRKGTPCSGWIAAIDAWMDLALGEPSEILLAWRARIEEALAGGFLAFLMPLLPRLSLFVDDPGVAPKLAPRDAEERFLSAYAKLWGHYLRRNNLSPSFSMTCIGRIELR
jgi:hypothetical protein